jgi:hypothetical protein
LTNVVQVSAGAAHNLVLKSDGTLAAWGDNTYSESVVSPGLDRFQAVSAGGYFSLAVRGNGAPVVLLQPLSRMAYFGDQVTFQVMAAGSGTLSYQWQKNGTNLLGATRSTYTIPGVQQEDSGTYRAVVSNFAGSTPSANAVLTATGIPPFIDVPLSDQTVNCGAKATLAVVVGGSPPFTFQWQHEGTNIPGATQATLTLNIVSPADAGTYFVTVSNPYGTASSGPAVLTVVTVPTISLPPQDQVAVCGATVTFRVTASGPSPLSYQWEFQQTPIPGATKSSLVLGPVTLAQAGNYRVVVSCPCGSVTSPEARLTLTVEPPFITSPLNVSGTQGVPFTYTIIGLNGPSAFASTTLPPGLTLNPTNGVISGIPLEIGVFGATITTYNACASDSKLLLMDFASSAPVVTSMGPVTGTEGQPVTFQITATQSPTNYGSPDIPSGFWVDPSTGLISGQSTYAGEFDCTIWASNYWGAGSNKLHFSITNALISGLSIANVTTNYSSPYLLDFQFSLRTDNDPTMGNALVVDPQLLTITCMENDTNVSPTETAVVVARGSSKVMKAMLVLDFTESIASTTMNGDTNGDGISDAVDMMVESAKMFVNQQPAAAQIGVYEFHREDQSPSNVVAITTDKVKINNAISGIWTNYVQWWPAASRCWDATAMAVKDLGAYNNDEQHIIVLVSDGRDESSTNSLASVIRSASTNGIKVYCVGFGSELFEDPLTNLTSSTSGRYYQATNVAQLGAQFAQIGKDLAGQYVLRWATLKRTTNAFQPSFSVTYQNNTAVSPLWTTELVTNITTNIDIVVDTNVTPPLSTTNITYDTNEVTKTNYIISPYVPTKYAGDVKLGKLRLVQNAEVKPTGITLRATYVPRYIRQMLIRYRPNFFCTPYLMSTNPGEILQSWTMTRTDDPTNGTFLLLSSPNTNNLNTSIKFGAFGNLIDFRFNDALPNGTNAFSVFEVITNIYANTGKQGFVLSNATSFVKYFDPLPMGTPVPWMQYYGISGNLTNAELADPDLDGVPTWQEYLAGSNPTNRSSVFAVTQLIQAYNTRWQVSFNSFSNRLYRVESSGDLINWTLVQDNIPGNGTNVTIMDTRWVGNTNQFFRVLVH